MLFRTIASAFFLDASSRGDLATLVARAGMTEVTPLAAGEREALGFHEPGRDVLGGRWGAFQETWAVLDEVEGIACLQFYSAATRYLTALREARSRQDSGNGPHEPYLRTFRDACVPLRPLAAFLDTMPHYEDEAWDNKQGSRTVVLSYAAAVANGDVDALADQRFNLLYVSEQLMPFWTDDRVRDDREFIQIPGGRLAFARGGPTRMA